MRYAHGILFGALLSCIIFLGAAVIKILALTWDVYVIWFFLSIVISIIPPIAVFAVRRSLIRELLIYEAGGYGLFSPLWLILFTDLSGDSARILFTEGITGGLVAPGIPGPLIPVDISNVILIPLLVLFIVVGIIFLRPSFIANYGVPSEPTELRELKKSAEPAAAPAAAPAVTPVVEGEDPIEKEMPEVAPPQANADTMADLRELLIELGTPEPTINLIFNAGFATTTDLVATSPEQLATLTGIDKRTAEDLHMAVQKKVWFGGI